jgi:ABC-type sugar transport system permease subunit
MATTPASPTGLVAQAGVRRVARRPQFWFGVFVLVPLLLWYAVFSFGPIVRALYISVVDYQLLAPSTSKFVGLSNFQRLLDYPLFWVGLTNTLLYAVTFFVFMLPLALLVSTCLVKVIHGRNLYQYIVFLPVVVSLIAISLLFKSLMDAEVGLFNNTLAALGLPRSRFLSGLESALPSVVAVDVWKTLGFYVVILTAGMLNIPNEIYDAGKVDGATGAQRFRFITLPLLAHTLALICVLIAMHGLQVFTQVVVLPPGPGGPGRATYVLNLLVYDEAFGQLKFGFATAAALVLFLIVLTVSVIQLRILRPSWSY